MFPGASASKKLDFEHWQTADAPRARRSPTSSSRYVRRAAAYFYTYIACPRLTRSGAGLILHNLSIPDEVYIVKLFKFDLSSDMSHSNYLSFSIKLSFLRSRSFQRTLSNNQNGQFSMGHMAQNAVTFYLANKKFDLKKVSTTHF